MQLVLAIVKISFCRKNCRCSTCKKTSKFMCISEIARVLSTAATTTHFQQVILTHQVRLWDRQQSPDGLVVNKALV